MFEINKLIEWKLVCRQLRMIAACDAGEPVVEGHAGDQTFRGVWKVANSKVYFSLAHQGFEVLGIRGAENNLNAGRLNGEIRHQ